MNLIQTNYKLLLGLFLIGLFLIPELVLAADPFAEQTAELQKSFVSFKGWVAIIAVVIIIGSIIGVALKLMETKTLTLIVIYTLLVGVVAAFLPDFIKGIG